VTRQEEIVFLRKEISRLKFRLSQLDTTTEPTSVSCGHDVLLDHIKKLCEQNRIKGITQLAFFDEEWGWSTTNLETRKIRKLLKYKNVSETLDIVQNPKIWDTLTKLFHHEDLVLDENIQKALFEKEIIDTENRLTSKGVFLYSVTGHLCYNSSVKQDIEIASQIFEQVYQITQTQYGDPLQISLEDLISKLKEVGSFEQLDKENIKESDVTKYYEQNLILFGEE
jgi:hypothetical protein